MGTLLITDSAALKDFCAALAGAPYVAVDCEFLHEKTYYPILCLLQVAHGAHAAAIDTLAAGIDLEPLWALLASPDVLKVFHAGSQDVGIILRASGRLPAPLFDTQIAGMVCGLGERPGYAAMVSRLLGVQIDKASQATDWSLRPLTDKQAEYAVADVTHLCGAYEQIRDRLAATGRASWVAEEMQSLADEAKYAPSPAAVLRRLKVRRATRRILAVLGELVAWREAAAVSRNLPRKWVVRDDSLIEIALNEPTDTAALARVRGLKPPVARGRDGKALLEAVGRATRTPPDSWPLVDERPTLDADQQGFILLLQALLRLRCEGSDVAASLVADRAALERLAAEPDPDIPALHGWRREVFGEEAMALREGRVVMSGQGGRVRVLPARDPIEAS